MRVLSKLQKKLGLWHCYTCNRITKPHWGYASESIGDLYGTRVPFCKIHIDKEKYGLYNYVNTEPMTRQEAIQDHIYEKTL